MNKIFVMSLVILTMASVSQGIAQDQPMVNPYGDGSQVMNGDQQGVMTEVPPVVEEPAPVLPAE